MQNETQLFVRGTNDKVLRRVQHIPKNSQERETAVVNPAKGFRGFLMFLGDPAEGVQRCVIREDRIIRKSVKSTGPLS